VPGQRLTLTGVEKFIKDLAIAVKPTEEDEGILSHMPAPINERHSLERELAELPTEIIKYQRELEGTPQENRARRERLGWQIRRDRKRMAQIKARLASGPDVMPPR
jgi:hypothetical protein